MTRARLTPLAESDIDAATAWYNARSKIAAAGFVVAVREVLKMIGDAPLRAPEVVEDIRRRNLKKPYPYTAFYVAEPDGPLVIGVLHHRRDPRLVQVRLQVPRT